VTQIARTVAEALGLNTDLAEALALVHDIGHSPFGHAGERRLDALMRRYGGSFDHNLHALRIVEQFEQRFPAHPGLNLTFEVREGIIKHSRDYSPDKFPELNEYLLDQRPSLEAQLIDRVDEIAYNTADLDDAISGSFGAVSRRAFCFLHEKSRNHAGDPRGPYQFISTARSRLRLHRGHDRSIPLETASRKHSSLGTMSAAIRSNRMYCMPQ